jgi:hypothetical protein
MCTKVGCREDEYTTSDVDSNNKTIANSHLYTWKNVLLGNLWGDNTTKFGHFASCCYADLCFIISQKPHICWYKLRSDSNQKKSEIVFREFNVDTTSYCLMKSEILITRTWEWCYLILRAESNKGADLDSWKTS